MRWPVSGVLLLLGASCSHSTQPGAGDGGTSWPEGDALFHQEPRWLGGDGAYSIDLGGTRTLWLFGDSFVATSPAHLRTESTMVRNSVAVMTGRDPTQATMQFAWTEPGDGGVPSAFFASAGQDAWHWPAHGVRFAGGPLLVFLSVTKATPNQGLGFTEAGWSAVLISNPDEPPSSWTQQALAPAMPPWDSTVLVGNAVVLDRDFVVALTSGHGASHTGWMVRWRAAEARTGDLSHPEWWNGPAGWVAQASLAAAPVAVLADAAPECSLHFDAARHKWVHVASRGFGASTVALRTSDALTGPYSEAVDVFTPPESAGHDPFVYAAKAHPELATRTGGRVLVTYATNSFTFADLFTTDGAAHLYWPRFVELELR